MAYANVRVGPKALGLRRRRPLFGAFGARYRGAKPPSHTRGAGWLGVSGADSYQPLSVIHPHLTSGLPKRPIRPLWLARPEVRSHVLQRPKRALRSWQASSAGSGPLGLRTGRRKGPSQTGHSALVGPRETDSSVSLRSAQLCSRALSTAGGAGRPTPHFGGPVEPAGPIRLRLKSAAPTCWPILGLGLRRAQRGSPVGRFSLEPTAKPYSYLRGWVLRTHAHVQRSWTWANTYVCVSSYVSSHPAKLGARRRTRRRGYSYSQRPFGTLLVLVRAPDPSDRGRGRTLRTGVSSSRRRHPPVRPGPPRGGPGRGPRAGPRPIGRSPIGMGRFRLRSKPNYGASPQGPRRAHRAKGPMGGLRRRPKQACLAQGPYGQGLRRAQGP